MSEITGNYEERITALEKRVATLESDQAAEDRSDDARAREDLFGRG